MMVNKYIFILITLILTFIVYNILDMSFLLGMVIVVLTMTLAYIFYMNYRQKKRYKIIEYDLDPQKFIDATHSAYRYAGKNKEINSLYNLDLSFAYVSLGEFELALEFLNKVEASYLPKLNKSILGYYGILLIVYYQLGEYDKAREVYKKAEEYKGKDKRSDLLIKTIRGNKYFYEGNYSESRKIFEGYPKEGMSKRLELEIIYIYGLIDEKEEDFESARSRYEKVVKEGNKLYIRKLAEEKLGLEKIGQ